MKYYAMIDGQQQGPFDLEELPKAGVRPSTYIWCKGMADWEKAEDVADVCRLFRNRLYDLMHPGTPAATEAVKEMPDSRKINLGSTDASSSNPPSRFDRYLKDQPQQQLPSLEEIDSMENTDVPPTNMIGYAWIVTLLCCPPTGIAALICAYKSRETWKQGKKKEAHDFARGAKLWTGVSFFIGIIIYAFLFRFVIT